MTENNDIQEKSLSDKVKQWIEDNLRLIISIVIVIAIAGGIYSYTQRSQTQQIAFDDDTKEQILIDDEEDTTDSEDVDAMMSETEDVSDDNDSTIDDSTNSDSMTDDSHESPEPNDTNTHEDTAPVIPRESRKTEGSYIEVARSGDGVTHLARSALKHSLEDEPDSSLTAAHKIYIEDYLRKNVHHSGSVHVGTEIEFSNSLISEAVSSAKTLNEAQLQNLEKYVALVPSLS